MPTRKKVTGLWTVTRNGPKPSGKWIVEMYIWTCRLPPRLPDSQERGRTTHGVYRGNGGGAGRPGDRLRRSGDTHSIANRKIFHWVSSISIFKGNPMEKSGRPVDSHEEWAQNPALVRDMVSRDVHLDLQAASPPLRSSGVRATPQDYNLPYKLPT